MTEPSRASWSAIPWGALWVCYAMRTLLAFCFAAPLATVLGAGLAVHPRGDAPLFEPGGYLLLDVLRRDPQSMLRAIDLGLWTLGVGALLSVVPSAILVAGVIDPISSLATAIGKALRAVPRLFALGLLKCLGQIAVLSVTVSLAFPARSWLSGGHQSLASDLVFAALCALGLVPALAISVLHDLARIHGLVSLDPMLAGLDRALQGFRLAPWTLLTRLIGLRTAWFASCLPAAWIASTLPLGDGAWFGLWLVLASHQSVILAQLLLEVYWQGTLLRLSPRQAGFPRATPAEPQPSST